MTDWWFQTLALWVVCAIFTGGCCGLAALLSWTAHLDLADCLAGGLFMAGFMTGRAEGTNQGGSLEWMTRPAS